MSAEVDELRAEIAALSRKVSCLTGRVTVLSNALQHEGGLIPATAAFQVGMEIGERHARPAPAAAPKRPRRTRPDHLRSVK